jgi:predicted RNA binding protein YcfA (HicA-like mRNA interferase family)
LSQRITPVHWRVLECIFQKAGFVFERQESSHRSYTKPGCARPIVIPTYSEVDDDIINRLRRTASMDRDKYFEYLEQCK